MTDHNYAAEAFAEVQALRAELGEAVGRVRENPDSTYVATFTQEQVYRWRLFAAGDIGARARHTSVESEDAAVPMSSDGQTGSAPAPATKAGASHPFCSVCGGRVPFHRQPCLIVAGVRVEPTFCDYGGGCERPAALDHRLCQWHQGYSEAWRRISKAIGGFPIAVYVDDTGRRVAAS